MNIQQTNYKNKINQISSLESLAEYAIDALAEESPSYFHGYEKAFTKEIQNYGLELVQECRNGNLLELSDKAIEKLALVEDRIGIGDNAFQSWLPVRCIDDNRPDALVGPRKRSRFS